MEHKDKILLRVKSKEETLELINFIDLAFRKSDIAFKKNMFDKFIKQEK